MDTTGKQLIEHLAYELAERRHAFEENREIGFLRKRIRFLTIALIVLMAIAAGGTLRTDTESPLKRVNYYIEPAPCPDTVISTLNNHPICIGV